MAQLLFANNANSTLAGAITNVATTANLASGTGVLFPNPGASQYFLLTLVDAATGLLNEIVQVTAISGDVITMVRAQEGTVAKSWLAGDLALNLWTAGSAAAMLQSQLARPTRLVTASGAFVTSTADANGAIGLNRTAGVAASSTTLPSGAQPSDVYTFQDLSANFQAFPLTVNAPAAMTIAGLASFVANVNRQSPSFRFYGSNIWGVKA